MQGMPSPEPFIVCIQDGLIHDSAWLLEELGAVYSICMFSYPVEQFDEEHQLPIIRTGKTCTTPGLDSHGRPEGYTNITAHEDDSGSPVLLLELGMYQNRHGVNMGNRCVFLGVHKGGLQNEAENVPEVEQTTGCYVKAPVL